MIKDSLFEQREEIRSRIDKDKALLKILNDKIYDRYSGKAKEKLYKDGKDFGTTNIFEEGMKIKCVFKKNVVWDTQALEDISSRLGSDLSQHYIDKKLTIRESRYKEAPPELIEMFSTARTVSTSGVIIEVDKEEVQ
jgi:hypothetical protein